MKPNFFSPKQQTRQRFTRKTRLLEQQETCPTTPRDNISSSRMNQQKQTFPNSQLPNAEFQTHLRNQEIISPDSPP